MINKFEIIRDSLVESLRIKTKKLKKLNDYLALSKDEIDEDEIEDLKRKISNLIDSISINQGKLNNLRDVNVDDQEKRKDIYLNYSSKVKEVIPDSIPLVFHGNNNIGIVEQIIESGGLFTPDERNISYKSFASQIDVTWKSNIQTSLEFAEPGLDSYLPYVAIFVFMPKEEEYQNVLNTKDSSEVFGGVQSIDFKKDDRLYAIITTDENIDKLKKCAKENGINENLIMTHDLFLDYCREKFNSNKKTI